MADKTKIGWTDATWNIVTGCSMVSAGCTNCYAMGLAASRLQHHPSRAGLTRETGGRPVWTGEVRFNEGWLDQPLRWRAPRRIFVCAHADLFHEAVPDEWIDRVFAVMALCPQHTFQVLTKRPERMREYVSRLDIYTLEETEEWRAADYRVTCDDDPNGSPAWHEKTALLEEAIHLARKTLDAGKPLPNVWIGTSIEDQATADARIPHLLQTPAAIRFVSAEPLLGEVDLTLPQFGEMHCAANCSDGCRAMGDDECPKHYGLPRLDLVIVGGESGPRARPMHPDWVRSLRDQCVEAGVAFHFKQWGEWAPGAGFACPDNLPTDGWHHFDPECSARRVGKKAAGRLLDGRTWDEMPGSRGVHANDKT